MTQRLYYSDSTLTTFSARILECDPAGLRVVLDRTAFYPSSGGQPHDTGTLGGVRVVDVLDEDQGIVHVLEAPLAASGEVQGEVDWPRRFDHMQQHSGQHLLSAVFEELFRFRTVSFHLGAEVSTIDLETPAIEPAQLRAAEARANGMIALNRPLSVAFEDASAVQGLRKESGREGELRIVSIEGYDRSACGGTHVGATGEIGAILLRRTEKIRSSVRVEFVCGLRAARRARADYEALSQVARLFSCPPDEAPALVAASVDSAKEAEKARRKLAMELAALRGRDLYASAGPGADGLRRHTARLNTPLDDEVRALAQGFCAQPRAVFLAACPTPPSVLLAVSADSGLHAGNLLKEALTAAGGRGGGAAQLAQGSLPSLDALQALLAGLPA
jgi:alanyl-tRNA synthetase